MIRAYRFKTGCQSIDDMLNGGIESGIVTEVFGRAGSGKTNFCIQLAAQALKNNKKVAYIDTEEISIDRVSQIFGDNVQEMLKNLAYYNANSFSNQQQAIGHLDDLLTNDYGIIILDSATALYRLEIIEHTTPEESVQTRRNLLKQLEMLKKLSQKYNIPVVITNQVYDDLKHENNVLPLGGNGTRHSLKASLKFEKEENGIRIATINRHRSLPEGVTCQFKIENSGLISLDDVEIPDEINNTDDDEFRFLT